MNSTSPWQPSRREFLRRAGGTAAFLLLPSGVLAACAGNDPASSSSSGGASTSNVVGPAELNFVGWEGYDGSPEAEFPAFRSWWAENQITLTATYVSDNPEILTKIQTAPAGTYDIASPYHGIVPTFVAADALEPIRLDRLENVDSVYEYFLNQDFFNGPGGQVYAVPFTFSHSVALYNADRVEPLERYAQVFEDPSLEGRYALVDQPEQLTWVASHLGYGNPDPHHLTSGELEEVRDLAGEAVAKARTMAGSIGDLLQILIAGEVDWAWYGTADMVGSAQAEGVNVMAFLPQEGNQTFVDAYAIPKGSENYDAALAWIDESLSPEVQAELAAVYGGGVVNPLAVDNLSEELKTLYDYDNLESLFERIPLLPPIPAEGDEFATLSDWVQAWEEAKL